MLFPFTVQLENLSLHERWTWRHYSTTASDVYAAVGSPVFRLRYGWLSILEPNVCKIPLTSLHAEDDLMVASGGEPSKGHPRVSKELLNHESGTPAMLDKAICALFGSPVAHTKTDTSQEHASGQQPHTAHDGRLESIAEMQADPRDSSNVESTVKLQQNANDWG